MCNSKQERWVLGMPWQCCCSPLSPFILVSSFVVKYPMLFFVRRSFAWLLPLTSSVDRWPQRNWIVTECPVLCEQWVYIPVMWKDSHGISPIKRVFCNSEKLVCFPHIPAKIDSDLYCSIGDKFLLVAVDKCPSVKVRKRAFATLQYFSVSYTASYITKHWVPSK